MPAKKIIKMTLAEKVKSYLTKKQVVVQVELNYSGGVAGGTEFSSAMVIAAQAETERIEDIINEIGNVHLGARNFFATPRHYHEGKLPGLDLELVQSYLLAKDDERVWIGFVADKDYTVEIVKKARIEGIELALEEGAKTRDEAEISLRGSHLIDEKYYR